MGNAKAHSRNHGIRSHHVMVNRMTMETVTDFILGGSKITVDGDGIHEINLSILKEISSGCSLEGLMLLKLQ